MECDVDLLSVLDAAVKADPAFPGVQGAVCIVVSDETGSSWWRASIRMTARLQVDAPVAMLRVYCSCPGQSAMMNFRWPVGWLH